MSLTPSPRQGEITAAARKMLEVWSRGFAVETAGSAAQAKALPDAPAWPDGHVHFYRSDHTVHRRPGWYASVKMLSSRMRSGGLINGEGKKGSRLSDGMFHLALGGGEYFTNNVLPTMDWSRLPGITVDLVAGAANSTFGNGSKAFVGGTGDGAGGVSAMDFAPVAGSGTAATAKKSWFFFDRSVVFLAGDVRGATAGVHVGTIVEQWPLQAEDAIFAASERAPVTTAAEWSDTVQDVLWAAADGVGYYFPGRADLGVDCRQRSGAWSDLGQGDTAVHRNRFLTLVLDHGVRPDGAAAAYAVVPGMDAAGMAEWSRWAPVSVMANGAATAAVCDNETRSMGAVFWSAGRVASLASSAPSVAWVVDEVTRVTVSAADPAQGTGTVRLTLNEALDRAGGDDEVVSTVQDGTTLLDFPRAGGVTHTVVLTRPAALFGAFSEVPGTGTIGDYATMPACRWRVAADGGDARLALDGTGLASQGDMLGAAAVVGAREHGDFTLSFDARSTAAGDAAADLDAVFGMRDARNYYYAMFNANAAYSALFIVEDGTRRQLAAADASLAGETYRRYEVSRAEEDIVVKVDGAIVMTASDATHGAGRTGVGSYNNGALFDNILVTYPGMDEEADEEPAGETPPETDRAEPPLADAAIDPDAADAGFPDADASEPPADISGGCGCTIR